MERRHTHRQKCCNPQVPPLPPPPSRWVTCTHAPLPARHASCRSAHIEVDAAALGAAHQLSHIRVTADLSDSRIGDLSDSRIGDQ